MSTACVNAEIARKTDRWEDIQEGETGGKTYRKETARWEDVQEGDSQVGRCTSGAKSWMCSFSFSRAAADTNMGK